MRLIFIRHGDPDYEKDSVTAKGEREIKLLADKMQSENVHAFYLSPKGRAQRTAEATLARVHRTGVTCGWLKEFTVPVRLPETGEEHLIWDFMPSFMDKYPDLYSAERWVRVPFIAASDVPKAYAEVCSGIDGLLEEYGYQRRGSYYRAIAPNRKTLVFFCHFGVTGVILSHLFHMSPVALLQHFCAAPSSVTTLYTEEREKGIASFRCNSYGDISHLYAAGEPPAFSARFCETYDHLEERH
mgnify:FL=1